MVGGMHKPIDRTTNRLLLALCVFWLSSAVLAGGIFHLKLFYVYFGWTALFLVLPQLAFGIATALVFLGWCHWLATGKERPVTSVFLIPASLLLWMAPFGFAFQEAVRIVMSGLVPYGRLGAEVDGWTEFRACLLPLSWFLVPSALSFWLFWRTLPRARASHLGKNR